MMDAQNTKKMDLMKYRYRGLHGNTEREQGDLTLSLGYFSKYLLIYNLPGFTHLLALALTHLPFSAQNQFKN